VRTRVPFVLICMGLLIAALLTALLLNTSMAQAAFETTDTQRQLSQLVQDNEELQAQLDEKSSPEQLAAQARALGMVPATGTGWVRLSDQTVSGAQSPAEAPVEAEAPGSDGTAETGTPTGTDGSAAGSEATPPEVGGQAPAQP
jgi:hypothetical protein